MHKNLFLLGFITSLCVLSFLFFHGVPKQLVALSHQDKWAHFIAFLALAFLCHNAFNDKMMLKIIGLALYGGLVELIQDKLPHRTGSWLDLAADIAGVMAFYLLLKIYLLIKAKRNAS